MFRKWAINGANKERLMDNMYTQNDCQISNNEY